MIAGVNGAGKSTLYQSMPELQKMPRVNSDEIVREFGSWKEKKDVIAAGKIAVKKIAQNFELGKTFNQETTLCGKSIIRNIRYAKQKGYIVEVHYVGLDSAEIAKNRVQARVDKGGHGIPEIDIEKRYIETFKNLKIVLPECNLIIFYDNTKIFRRFAIYKNGVPMRISHDVPEWFYRHVWNEK